MYRISPKNDKAQQIATFSALICCDQKSAQETRKFGAYGPSRHWEFLT
jgi:hypothetical protein